MTAASIPIAASARPPGDRGARRPGGDRRAIAGRPTRRPRRCARTGSGRAVDARRPPRRPQRHPRQGRRRPREPARHRRSRRRRRRAPVPVLVCEAGPGSRATRRRSPPAATSSGGRRPRRCASTTDGRAAPRARSTSAPTGRSRFVQLTGRVPCRIDGEPLDAATPPSTRGRRSRSVPAGSAWPSRWTPPAPVATVATAGDPWRRTIRRTPRAPPRWDPSPIPVPAGAAGRAARTGAAGLLAAAFTPSARSCSPS